MMGELCAMAGLPPLHSPCTGRTLTPVGPPQRPLVEERPLHAGHSHSSPSCWWLLEGVLPSQSCVCVPDALPGSGKWLLLRARPLVPRCCQQW